MPSPPCKLTISSYLFARWHFFRHVGYSCFFIWAGPDLFAVVGESFFGDVDTRFSRIFRTMWTMFELLTCDDWYYTNMALEFKGQLCR